jgi:glycosyltransferase involved in cell wall biosynthesis
VVVDDGSTDGLATRISTFADRIKLISQPNSGVSAARNAGLNAATGEFLWKYPTEGGIVSKPAINDTSLFFGSEDRRLHAINARFGRLIWTYSTDAPVRSSHR